MEDDGGGVNGAIVPGDEAGSGTNGRSRRIMGKWIVALQTKFKI